MQTRLASLVESISQEATRLASFAVVVAYEREGGSFDDEINHRQLIADLGPKQAAFVCRRYLHFRSSARRLYLLNPAAFLAHVELRKRGYHRGWFKRAGEVASPP